MDRLFRAFPALSCLVLSAFPALAVTITPASATLNENATQQFTASAPSTWTTTCGSVSSAGLFKAPLYPTTTCKVTATATDGSGSASASVTVVSPIVMTPVSAKTPQGQTQQFTASMPVTWIAKCGSISSSGLYTASGTVGSNCTIEAIATTSPKFTAYGYDSITPPTVTISPLNPTVSEGGTQQFTASTASTFTASCGTISSAGLFTAPLSPGSCVITATATNGSGSKASTTATVTSPIAITPVSAVTAQGQTQQFSANQPVTWSTSCGSISATGLFKASATPGSACTITATASSGTAYTARAVDTVGAAAVITITPLSPTLPAGTQQQFTSSVPATWTASCGTIGATTGLYQTPASTGSCTVTATATDGSGHVTSTVVTVSAALAITPATVTTPQRQTQQFTANYPVRWSASCGSITSAGLFTASAPAGSVCTITGTATSGPANSATALDTIGAPAQLTLSPLMPTVIENATQQFTTNVPATFAASCGVIDPNGGLFIAPFVPGTCKVIATATDGSGSTASTNVTVTSPIIITPSAVSLHALNAQSFTASQPVTWSASCGSISSSGGYTAPAVQGNCTITATGAGLPAYTAQATVKVDVANYTAWKGGGGNLGAQTDELSLTPGNVNSNSFGIVWTASVDGWVSAQPLYMNALMIDGVPHNVVFIETANDSVYAFDGDTGVLLWQVSLIPLGATAVSATSVGFNSAPLIGILSTPVIDPTTNTMYVVSETSEQNATYFPHRLHALDITSGQEKFGGPVLVSDPNMAPVHKLQRPGLTLANGNVYVGIGSMQDIQPFHGLLFAFDTATLAEKSVWVVTPTGSEGGIWMGGASPSVDENGNIYVATGNGTFDGATNFGEAVVKLSPSLQVLDYFAPYNWSTYDAGDFDLGSGDVMIVPPQNGLHPHELITCGKPTPIYVINRDNLGQVGTTSDGVIQRLDNQLGQIGPSSSILMACFTAPAMWGQNVYFGGKYDYLKMFTLDPGSGLLSSTPVSQDTLAYGYPGTVPVVSANGSSNGIVWAIDTSTKTLRALDATNLGNLLYSQSLGSAIVRWSVPTVVNGHVYVAEQGWVVAFSTY